MTSIDCSSVLANHLFPRASFTIFEDDRTAAFLCSERLSESSTDASNIRMHCGGIRDQFLVRRSTKFTKTIVFTPTRPFLMIPVR